MYVSIILGIVLTLASIWIIGAVFVRAQAAVQKTKYTTDSRIATLEDKIKRMHDSRERFRERISTLRAELEAFESQALPTSGFPEP
ncbi:MAG: hypothetical protein EOM25_01385 [Deltaproteobacteria bacterium]|nr:hypothetical protein [Deltaproteobacteria bacterium]